MSVSKLYNCNTCIYHTTDKHPGAICRRYPEHIKIANADTHKCGEYMTTETMIQTYGILFNHDRNIIDLAIKFLYMNDERAKSHKPKYPLI